MRILLRFPRLPKLDDPFPFVLDPADCWAIGTIVFVWLCYAAVIGGLISAGNAGGF